MIEFVLIMAVMQLIIYLLLKLFQHASTEVL